MDRSFLTRFAWLSIGAALTTIVLKSAAYFFTGSVGLLSDAAESIVNLIGASVALIMLTIAARPADDSHAYGHSKAEYFSSGIEGLLIVIAAISIAALAMERLINPRALAQIDIGMVMATAASGVNFGVARVLLKAGKQYNSITLEADAKHLMTDVWTSVGVLAGVGAVALTGWERLDPIIALLVGGTIVWSGVRIVRNSVLGLMDTGLAAQEQITLQKVLAKHTQTGVKYHALRTRQSGARRFVSLHVLVPGIWTVQRGHQLLERIEADLRHALSNVTVFTHLESLNDPASGEDMALDRVETASVDPPPNNIK